MMRNPDVGSEQPRSALAIALVPVVTRALERGSGPPGLVAWVRAAVAGRAGSATAEPGLFRDLADSLASRLNAGGVVGTVAELAGRLHGFTPREFAGSTVA